MTFKDCKRILLTEMGCPVCGEKTEYGHAVTATEKSGDGSPLAAEYLGNLDGEFRRVAVRIFCSKKQEARYLSPQVFTLEELAKLSPT